MNDYHSNKLVKDFPNLYRRCRYFDVGDGWFDLIYDLSMKIQQRLKKMPKRIQREFAVDQVKAKWSGLRYYTNMSLDGIDELIENAEGLSHQTCESCGRYGRTRNVEGWFITTCNFCMRE